MRVVVVGAGFAGLMAAWRLRQSGHDVVVLEARDRVGGRVWSYEIEAGDRQTRIERGAEFILSGYDLMESLMDEFGLALAPMGMSYYVREPRGVDTTHQAVAVAAGVVSAAAATAPRNSSLADLLYQLEQSDAADANALAAFRSRLEVTNACTAERLSAAAAADVALAFEPNPSYRVAGGNQRVATELSSRLGDVVRLGEVVRSINWDQASCRVVTDTGELDADEVVVATPMAVTRELEFDPPLPKWKLDAWGRAGVGQAAKLHIPFVEDSSPVAWSAVQNVPERFWTWTATDETGGVQPMVHCFSGSGSALDALMVEAGPRTWADHVASTRDDLPLDLDRAVVTTWADEPFSREAYTAITVETEPGDDVLLQRPVGPLHFAGEHTAGDWAGLMEGALRSGERAADEVPAQQ
ncbi:MAG TPA: NAD(P)/FAD-dependent oxidoreductase [Actinomycetes bacterium]|nr:NAD(P)/FAD-dependent oxidoreductase [Actinomycetes bacterium]